MYGDVVRVSEFTSTHCLEAMTREGIVGGDGVGRGPGTGVWDTETVGETGRCGGAGDSAVWVSARGTQGPGEGPSV